jgi:L,D-transpeptidase YcbB
MILTPVKHALRLFLVNLILWAAVPASAQAPQLWDKAAARELLGFAQGIGREGLDPADYALPALTAAIESGTPAALDMAATRSFAALAHDLADGHVAPSARGRESHFAYPTLKPADIEQMMELALNTRTVAASLAGLLPGSADYRALREALARTPAKDIAQRQALRVNMERWRWLPRDLSGRFLLVDLPAFELKLFDNGEVTARHRIVIGKAKTQTPEFAARVTAVQINPDWNVPDSIIAESVGKLVRTRPAVARARGYTWSYDASGRLKVVQGPGSDNSLGQLKLIMPNPYSIYVHDTPAKSLFERGERAFSHGCIRTENPAALAGRLLEGVDWDQGRVEDAIATGAQTTVALPRPIPILVAYLTAALDANGSVRYFKDLYRRDPAVAAALGADAGPVSGLSAHKDAAEDVCPLG